MRHRIPVGLPAALLALAAVLLLSGCSLIWSLPAPGVVALIVAGALAWAAQATHGGSHRRGAPEISSHERPAAAAQVEAKRPAEAQVRAGHGAADGSALSAAQCVVEPGARVELGAESADSAPLEDHENTASGDSVSATARLGVWSLSIPLEPQPRRGGSAPLPADAVTVIGDGLWEDSRTASSREARPSAVGRAGTVLFGTAAGTGRFSAMTGPAPGGRGEDSGGIVGDGIEDAAIASWLALRTGDAVPEEPLVVFSARPAVDRGGADPAFVPALEIVGDGFGAPEGRDYRRVADGRGLNPKEGDPEAIARGGIKFSTRCGTYCHGGRAIGGGCPSLVDEAWIHGDSDLDIYKVIVGGGGPGTRMGAFGGELTTDEIWEIIAYLRYRNGVFLMEKAGPNSYRSQGAHCPGELKLSIVTNRNRTFEGVIVIEDEKSVTVEIRGERTRRYRVKKERIDKAELSCVDES